MKFFKVLFSADTFLVFAAIFTMYSIGMFMLVTR